MANSIHEVVKQEGKSNKFEFVGIDTKGDDLDATLAEGLTKIALEKPEFWHKHQGPYPYLTEDYELDPTGGATRQRAVSRYYIDNSQNFRSLYDELERTISDFVDDSDASFEQQDTQGANLWLLNSLGGGTGSGAFPVLSFMLKRIADRSEENFFFGGIGSLPRLDRIGKQDIPPRSSPSYHANAYAALRELLHITDSETDGAESNYPMSIPLESDGGLGDSLRLSDPPFDFYGLLGFKESEMSPDYRDDMNRVVADTIFYFSKMDGLENWRSDQNTPDEVVNTLDGRSVRVPVRDVRRLLRVIEQVNELDDELEEVEDSLGSYKSDRNYLESLRDYSPDLEDPTGLDSEVVTAARSHADSVDYEYLGEEQIEELRSSLVGQVPDTDHHFEMNLAAEFLFYLELETEFEELLSDHEFEGEVESQWELYADSLDNVEHLDGATARQKWEGALQEFFEDWKRSLEDELEETSRLRISKRRELQEDLDSVEGTLDHIDALYDDFSSVDDAKDYVTARRREHRERLSDVKGRIESEIEQLSDRRDELEEELRQRRNEREAKEDVLTGFKKERHAALRFNNFEELTENTLDTASNIPNLLERGVISEDDVATALAEQIDSLEEQIEDRDPKPHEVHHYTELATLLNESNSSLLDLDVGDHDVPSVRGDFDDDSQMYIGDSFSIRFVAMYAPESGTRAITALKNSSEFGTIDEYYHDEERHVSDLFDLDEPDEEYICSKFAYPEFFTDDDRIQAYFDYPENTEAEPASTSGDE